MPKNFILKRKVLLMKPDKKNTIVKLETIYVCSKLILMYKTKEIRTNNGLILVVIKGFRLFKQVVRRSIRN